MSYSFKHLNLRRAEEQVVAACIDYRHAMCLALENLSVDDFRSEAAADLRLVFYTLAGWYANGTYDALENRDRLLPLHQLANSPRAEWLGYLEQLVCPGAVVPEYADGLVTALKMRNAMYDARLEASVAFRDHNPLDGGVAAPATPPQPVMRGSPPPPPRARGGVQ